MRRGKSRPLIVRARDVGGGNHVSIMSLPRVAAVCGAPQQSLDALRMQSYLATARLAFALIAPGEVQPTNHAGAGHGGDRQSVRPGTAHLQMSGLPVDHPVAALLKTLEIVARAQPAHAVCL